MPVLPLRLRRLLLLLVLATTAVPGAGAQSPEAKRGPGVLEALREEGEAAVVIALAAPTASAGTPLDLAAVRREVAALQADVLAVLGPSEYRGRHRFEAVPALAGHVLSEGGLGKLLAHPNVLRVDLDAAGHGGLEDSVPLIRADEWHARGNTGDGVVVAVLDSGADTDHPDLADDLVHQECFLDADGSINGVGRCPNGSDRQSGPGAAEDDHGHGTHVTGIVTSGGVRASVGVAPDAGIVAVKVLDANNAFAFFSEIVAALDFVINNPQLGVRVVNMSLGTAALFSGPCDTATSYNIAGAAAINTLRAGGVTAFAASLNNGSGTQMSSPACLSNVVSVGATNDADVVASFTNSNATLDLMAPGVAIVSSGLGGGTAVFSGTSMASPHAAGCAALLIASGEATAPDAIEAFMEDSPVSVTDPKNGLSFPRLDCFSPLPNVAVALAPQDPPITITPGDRTFSFTARLLNATAQPQIVDVWTEATLPSGAGYGPIVGPLRVTVPGGGALTRTLSERVPSGAPLGAYTYTAYVGTYPAVRLDEGAFSFTVAAATAVSDPPQPSQRPGLALEAAPNPFRSRTAVHYVLSEAGPVRLAVYDALGREVALLAEGVQPAGPNEVLFDAPDLPSGLYLVHLATSEGLYTRTVTRLR